MFEKASRLKLRFKSQTGLITTEDLWNVSLEHLNTIAKGLNKEIKDSAEEDFIKVKSNADDILELKFEIVKHIIKVKMEEDEAKKTLKEKAEKRKKILALIEEKQSEQLSAKSIEELRKELENY